MQYFFSVGLQWLNESKKNYFQSKDLIKTIIRKQICLLFFIVYNKFIFFSVTETIFFIRVKV